MTLLIEGFTSEEILALSHAELDGFILTGQPVVFKVGTAEILGSFKSNEHDLVVTLAHIDGGGEGVLPILTILVERYACHKQLSAIEWIVHAVNCAKPNLKLRRVLGRRGFTVRDVDGTSVYYFLQALQ